jgi:hypothetical protein
LPPAILFVLVLLGLAVPVLLIPLGRALERSTEAMINPQYTSISFKELPAWVAERLARLRDQFMALGFREVSVYTRKSPRLNYTCSLVAPDGTTLAEVSVARIRGIMLVAAPLLGWSMFKREVLAEPHFELQTHFPGGRLFETTPIELSSAHLAGETEFSIVPETMPLQEMVDWHRPRAREFAARCGVAPIRITGEKEGLEVQGALTRRLGERLKRNRERR